ncbi:MAG: hypothetical protein JKY37_32010, partial [Nannocystaceae bacterium]|nr:hypothetical protein [Nannocystaceae bacterium]
MHNRLEEILETGGTLPYQTSIASHVSHLAAIVKGDSPLEVSGAAVLITDNRAANEEWFKLRVSDLERIESMLEKLAMLIGRPDVGAIETQLVEVHDTLRNAVVSVRRVPLDMLLSKVGRLCRETADELDKLVRVETSATGVSAPKHLFAALSGSLVHLARNAVDHGLENQEERRASGKPPMATVTCTACWEDGWLIVEVRDDGRGISAARVADKAIRQALIPADHSLDGTEIIQLVL